MTAAESASVFRHEAGGKLVKTEIGLIVRIPAPALSILLLCSMPAFAQQSRQGREVTATYTNEGFTLSITSRCQSPERPCPFRAEVHAPPALFESIGQVEYNFFPGRPKSSAPVTDASTSFSLEAEQTAGEKVYASVTLRPRRGSQLRVVNLEGAVPFEDEVKPPLPAGMRFEIQCWPEYLEGAVQAGYRLRVRLRGDAAALKQIKSVEYDLPAGLLINSANPRVVADAQMEYLLEGVVSGSAGAAIRAVIRWKNGARSTHEISLRPRW